jgi:uncharacterized membrane protein YvbJ
MKCYNCGNELPQNSQYCLSCGKKRGDKGETSGQEFTGEPEERKKSVRSSLPPQSTRALRIISGMFAIIMLIIATICFF